MAKAPTASKVTDCDIVADEAGVDKQFKLKGSNLDIFTTDTDELVIRDLDVPGLAGLIFAGEKDKWKSSTVVPRKGEK